MGARETDHDEAVAWLVAAVDVVVVGGGGGGEADPTMSKGGGLGSALRAWNRAGSTESDRSRRKVYGRCTPPATLLTLPAPVLLRLRWWCCGVPP